MRYLSLILFAGFLVFSVDFATQNTELVVLNYDLSWVNFAFGIIFSVFYFFFYHAVLLRNLRKQKKEIKRLKHLVAAEREKHGTMEERNSELQQIVERVQSRVGSQDDLEPLVLENKETAKITD